MTEDMTIIGEEAYRAAKELLELAQPQENQILVVGCSTSEVGGAGIGTFPALTLLRWSSAASIRRRRRPEFTLRHSAASI